MKYSEKINKILAFSGWTKDHLADLTDVANGTLSSWARGDTEPKGEHAELIDMIFSKLVEPFLCDLEKRSDRIEKTILQAKIRDLPNDNMCN